MSAAAILLALGAGRRAAPPATGEVTVALTGLRSTKGLVQACLTRDAQAFPDCRKDPAGAAADAWRRCDAGRSASPRCPPGAMPSRCSMTRTATAGSTWR